MRVEPARIEQVRQAADGRMLLISADASSVAADLQQIDKCLKVRFAEHGNPPFWAVYHESEDGRSTYLVLTQRAYQNRAGVWEGLDGRIVERVREIDSHGRSGYDYAAELERNRQRRERERRAAFRERVGDAAERTAHQLRTDLGLGPYKGRIFKPREVER